MQFYVSVLYAADEGLRAEMSCIQLLNNLLCIAHKLFAYYSPAVLCIAQSNLLLLRSQTKPHALAKMHHFIDDGD